MCMRSHTHAHTCAHTHTLTHALTHALTQNSHSVYCKCLRNDQVIVLLTCRHGYTRIVITSATVVTVTCLDNTGHIIMILVKGSGVYLLLGSINTYAQSGYVCDTVSYDLVGI